MMESGEPTIIPGQHGGARPGAGRTKKADQVDGPDPYVMLAKAKAKREAYRASLSEIEYKQKIGELYERGEVHRVIASAVALFAEHMRSLPDKLERNAGINSEQAEIAEDEVDAHLEDLKAKLLAVLSDE